MVRGRTDWEAAVLTSVLPGLRELRAPLSAGFLWLLALWFGVEPSLPVAKDASGAVASAYRLSGVLSVIGLAAALTFAAYIVGSLSVFLFSSLLRSGMSTSLVTRRGRFDALTSRSRRSLRLIGSDSREKLGDALGLSRVTVADLVQEASVAAGGFSVEELESFGPSKIFSEGPGGPPPEAPEIVAERLIKERIVADLRDILDVRLLGRDPELYSRLDRGEAEVSFRLAVVPPVLALAVVLGIRLSPPTSLLVIFVGLTSAAGLVLDAVRQQRQCYELVLALLADGRLTSPSIDRLLRTANRLSPTFATPLETQAQSTLQAVQRLFAGLAAVPASEPAHSRAALELLGAARREFDELLERVDDGHKLDAGGNVLNRLETVARSWQDMNEGLGPPALDLRAEVAQAREDYDTFVGQLRDIVTAAAERTQGHPDARPGGRS